MQYTDIYNIRNTRKERTPVLAFLFSCCTTLHTLGYGLGDLLCASLVKLLYKGPTSSILFALLISQKSSHKRVPPLWSFCRWHFLQDISILSFITTFLIHVDQFAFTTSSQLHSCISQMAAVSIFPWPTTPLITPVHCFQCHNLSFLSWSFILAGPLLSLFFFFIMYSFAKCHTDLLWGVKETTCALYVNPRVDVQWLISNRLKLKSWLVTEHHTCRLPR